MRLSVDLISNENLAIYPGADAVVVIDYHDADDWVFLRVSADSDLSGLYQHGPDGEVLLQALPNLTLSATQWIRKRNRSWLRVFRKEKRICASLACLHQIIPHGFLIW